MANTSECTRAVQKLKLSDSSCSMGTASSDLELVTALATEIGSGHASTSSSTFSSARAEMTMVERMESGKCPSIEEQIQRSKSHWSELVELDSDEEAVAEIDNVQVFNSLQSHPNWGAFFHTFHEDYGSSLVVGEKFAEGGQAKLYHAQVKWYDPHMNEQDLREGYEYVVKVFRKGTFLRHLQLQLPPGLFQERIEVMERNNAGIPQDVQYGCEVMCGTLLRDDRFAFVLLREQGDLRSRIDRKMMKRANHECGPFSEGHAELIMYHVALGMEWLHNLNIVHRDVKASNVLCSKYPKYPDGWWYIIADYECSIGVVGTGFWRAPEILQACRDKVVNKRQDLFTKAVDVYGYGMTCYEILTGKCPFEGHPTHDYDLVLKGQRPEVPDYVNEWIRELLSRCWESNPTARPTFGDILDILLTNSGVAKKERGQIEQNRIEHLKQYEQNSS